MQEEFSRISKTNIKVIKNVLRFQAFRHRELGQPSISYRVIRRFISSKEFETPFGLQLLANTLNDILRSDKVVATTFPIDHAIDRYHSTRAKASVLFSEGGSCSSDVSDNTVLYDMDSSKELRRGAKNDMDTDKETFFSSSDSAEGSLTSITGRKRRKRKSGRGVKKKDEKKATDEDEEDKELYRLLRMTDVRLRERTESRVSNEEEDDKEQEKSKKKNRKKKEKSMSLLDCLDDTECLEEESNPEPEIRENDKNFLSTINSEMKSVFLQSSSDSGESSEGEGENEGKGEGENEGEGESENEGKGEGESEGERKDENEGEGEGKNGGEEEGKGQGEDEAAGGVEGGEKKKLKSGKKDELRNYRFPSTNTEDEASEKSESTATKKNTENVTLSDDSSSSSVEYVQHVRKGRRPSKDNSKLDAPDSDSSSDIQQIYCKTQSPSSLLAKGRKNINKILKKDSLQIETKQALKMETERKKRVNERMKLFQELLPSDSSKLILDFDPDTRKELVTVNSKLSVLLKPHQKEGVRFMWNCCFESLKRLQEDSGSGCVLAHCMGLGKTLQVITLVHTILTQNIGVHTVMIICPLNTLRNWMHEFRTWQKNCEKKIRPVDLIPCRTNFNRAVKVREWCQEGGVLLISYDMFRTLIKKDGKGVFKQGFLDPGPDLVVCDEGHVLKNSNSALSKSVLRIKTLRRIILTGTPLQNNLIEYYCMVQFVKPNILGTKREFLNRFVNPINNGQFEDSTEMDVRLMKRRAHVLHTMLEGFIQRRGYYVLRPFLPEKQEYVISVSLTATQANIYKLFIERCTEEYRGLLKDFHWMQKVWTHPRVMLMHSRKNRSEDAAPEQWQELVREDEYDSLESSGKVVLLFSILKRCKEIGDKVLVFSQSLYSLDLIEFFLQKANSWHSSGSEREFADQWVLGKDYFRLDGSTSSDNRDAYCQGFNSVEGGRARLFLISTKAGGLGINLVAANRVIVFDASWNPTHDVQSIFRVYRFGQKKTCYIYRFLAAATMEEKIYKRQVTKLSLAHRILDEHQIERHYTMGNLQELYRYDPIPKTEWRVPKIPKDSLFAEILASNRDIIVGYHEHDSLLENKEEEELTEEERRAAWEDYEKEKLTPEHPRWLTNGNFVPIVPAIPGSTVHWVNSQNLGAVPGMSPAPPQSALINQSGSDMCKIVEVRTLRGGGGGDTSEGRNLKRLMELGKAFGLNQPEGQNFDLYREKLLRASGTVFPWKDPRNSMRGNVNGVNGI